MIGKFIKFGDKDYLLRYGFKAFAKMENVFGKPLKEIDLENLPVGDIPKVIWAGLNANIPLDEVEKMIDESDYTITDITDVMGKAICLGTTGKENVEADPNA